MVTEKDLQDAQRRYQEAGSALDDALNDLKDARNDLKDARNALTTWRVGHEGHDIFDPEYVQLMQELKDAANRMEHAGQLLQNADKLVENALHRWEDARALVREVTVQRTQGPPVEMLTAIHPEAEKQFWKYVVKISLPLDFSATALIVDKTSTHIYLLTNLHLWVDDKFAKHLSTDFTDQIQELKLINKETAAMSKANDAGFQLVQPDRNGHTAANIITDQPEIRVEQLQESSMVEIFKFKLSGKVCWESSADFDFAILQIELPEQEASLSSCPMATVVYPTMNVHILGFPAGPTEQRFGHAYAKVTGMHINQMILSALSAPGLSETAIICSYEGVVLGYLGCGFESTSNNEQCQAYGFTLQGLPFDLPRYLERSISQKVREQTTQTMSLDSEPYQ